jgi:F-type H+-transporting ATPase subunit epsilon
MANFTFELVSPEKLLFSGEVQQVDVPGIEGDFGVLADHAPMVTTLRPGILTVHAGSGTQRIVVLGGFAEVSKEGLTVLADVAEAVEDIDHGMIANRIADASVPMSLLADHPQVQFNFYRPGIGRCEVEMH